MELILNSDSRVQVKDGKRVNFNLCPKPAQTDAILASFDYSAFAFVSGWF